MLCTLIFDFLIRALRMVLPLGMVVDDQRMTEQLAECRVNKQPLPGERNQRIAEQYSVRATMVTKSDVDLSDPSYEKPSRSRDSDGKGKEAPSIR